MDLYSIVIELIPYILNLYWWLVVGAIFVTFFDLPVPQSFKDAVILSAARGKLWKNRPSSLGFLKDLSVPHSFFTHFYVIGVFTTLMIICWIYWDPEFNLQQLQSVRLLLFEVHVFRRLLECCLLFKYPPNAKMHALAYIFALSYYVVVPLSWLEWEKKTHEQATFCSLFPGLMVFAIGSYIQFQSHQILSNLSSKGPINKSGAGGSGYTIPAGGLFNYVSCPHYFGEIIIYVGFIIIGRGCYLRTALVLCWVVLNLLLAADATDQWYQSQFGDLYVKLRRRKILPFVY